LGEKASEKLTYTQVNLTLLTKRSANRTMTENRSQDKGKAPREEVSMTTTRTIHGVVLTLQEGDITKIQAEAIVNAANAALAGGGGVDGAIHDAAGPGLMDECRKIGGCPTGSAVATSAGNLAAKYIFHAVGPIYEGSPEDERLLRSAYQTCLDLAEKHQVQSIVFPSPWPPRSH
jgi:hypothetical protein